MLAFNAWYYSFSPPVANSIANHWGERMVMQAVLYPLIGIMDMSYGTFRAFSAFPELAIVMAGVMASALLGALYLGLPVGLIRARVKRLRATKMGSHLERILGVATMSSSLLLAIGEMSGSSLILMISSSSLVLSTLLLSSTITSNSVARLIARLTTGGRAN